MPVTPILVASGVSAALLELLKAVNISEQSANNQTKVRTSCEKESRKHVHQSLIKCAIPSIKCGSGNQSVVKLLCAAEIPKSERHNQIFLFLGLTKTVFWSTNAN